MEKITIVEGLGYYTPSNANWSWRTHLIIDKKGARLYKEQFGGDSRLRQRLEEEGYEVVRLYAGKGGGVQLRRKDIKDLLDIEAYQAHQNY